jgi:hypothetical protein
MNSAANFMWNCQQVLHHKNNPIVPAGLMLIAGSLNVYHHLSSENDSGLKTFLAMILMQMLPLVILELKIMSCADPVGLFCKFAAPVTLLHSIFLLQRVCQYPLYEQGYVLYSVAGLAGAIWTMHAGYRQRWFHIHRYTAVWNLVAIAVMAAFCTESAEAYFGSYRYRNWGKYLTAVLQSTNCYVELMAFVPAVWMVYREGMTMQQATNVDSIDTKRTSTAFFLFLVIFYFTEDIHSAYEAMFVSPLAAVAHVVHFLLLLDFAFYVLAHVYNPTKLMGELRKWLPADLACAV